MCPDMDMPGQQPLLMTPLVVRKLQALETGAYATPWLRKGTPNFDGSMLVLHDVVELYEEQRPQALLFTGKH